MAGSTTKPRKGRFQRLVEKAGLCLSRRGRWPVAEGWREAGTGSANSERVLAQACRCFKDGSRGQSIFRIADFCEKCRFAARAVCIESGFPGIRRRCDVVRRRSCRSAESRDAFHLPRKQGKQKQQDGGERISGHIDDSTGCGAASHPNRLSRTAGTFKLKSALPNGPSHQRRTKEFHSVRSLR